MILQGFKLYKALNAIRNGINTMDIVNDEQERLAKQTENLPVIRD